MRKRAKSSCFWGIAVGSSDDDDEDEDDGRDRDKESGWMRSNSVRRKDMTEMAAGWWKTER